MKKIVCILISFLIIEIAISQPMRIAILDFDNISGIAKYDGLGKAMSSMLISDIESNVSPKRLQLVERAQINKIMKEQNLQKSTSFDKNTSVKMGKLLGVNFLLIGDIYILDNSLVINARLTDASSGDIKFSEKQEGKINEWLTVKSKLGKSVSTSISMPFTQPRIPDGIISTAVLTTYASAIDENDKGNFEKAETLISTAKEFNPDFGYLDDLRDEVEKLKKQVAEQGKKIEVLEKSDINQNQKISEIDNRILVIEKRINEGMLISNPTKLEDYIVNAYINYNNSNFKKAELMFEKIFNEGYFKYDLVCSYYEVLLNNYDADTEKIRKKLNDSGLLTKSLFFRLAELEQTYTGLQYYVELSKINIEDSLLKAFMENIKGKSFYVGVQNEPEIMANLMKYWTPVFIKNKKTLGLKIIKSKKLFFNYSTSYKRYIANTSYSNDDNTIFDFYINQSNYSESENNVQLLKSIWLKYCSEK